MRRRCFFSLATVGSDVSIRDGLNSWPVCVGFFGYDDHDDGSSGRINLLVWVMGLWECGNVERERERKRAIYVL